MMDLDGLIDELEGEIGHQRQASTTRAYVVGSGKRYVKRTSSDAPIEVVRVRLRRSRAAVVSAAQSLRPGGRNRNEQGDSRQLRRAAGEHRDR